MNKHHIFKYLLAGLLATGTVACEDRLDIQPEQSLSNDLAFANELSAQGSLIGVYSLAQDLDVFGSMPQVIAEFQPDNVDFIGSFPTLQEINNYTTLSDNSSISTIWRDHYRLILAANAVIKNVPTVDDPGFTEGEKTQFMAEAKFMRAMTYFQLVNLFAESFPVADGSNPGVPLVLDPFEGEVTLPERSTLNQVHTQIQQDLQDAATGLVGLALGPERATSAAAQGLLSRLHLYRGEWQQAADMAKSAMETEGFALASNYTFYSQNTPEEIFSLQNSATDNGRTGSGGWASFFNPAETGARGDAPFSQDLLDAYAQEPADKRFTELTQVGANEAVYTTKYPDPTNNSDNVPLIRVTEMYLNRAEALAQLNGVNQESIDLMNMLRTRAGLPAWAIGQFASKEAFIDAILNERRKELAFEGHRRMDLLRNNKPLRTSGPFADQANPGDPKTILPIPQREVDLNPSLSQNSGY